MRTAAAQTNRLWRLTRTTLWRRSALAAGIIVLGLIQLAGSQAAVSATPDQVGQWSAPVAWPLVAVHMSLEPDGRVFTLDGFDAALNSERLWNPVNGTFTAVPYNRNLFCAGHVQLADGRTLIVGGHITANSGLADTTIFDSRTNTYFRGRDMSVGRWYPTATVLPDGRVLAFSGDNIVQDRPGATHPFSDASVDSLPSVYDPKTNTWTDLTSATLTSPLYPFMFVLSDGRVFDAGPDTTTRILNLGSSTWTTVGTSPIDGMGAVMYRPNKIMKAGTWADPDWNGALAYNAAGGTVVIDMSAPTPTWRSTAPMAFGRSYNNLTLLPDGTVLASGGMSTSDGTDLTKAVLPAEIWNPDTETWTTVASLENGREYHSTALLMLDGRVLMAGGGALPGRATDQKNAEIYSPPYLFKGARPTISSAPLTATYGSSFDIQTPDAAQITKVSLIRSPSVTHGFDQNQRFQFLNFTQGAGKITVQAPANANLAPPGDYMLFMLNGSNVPSTGVMMTVSSPVDSAPPTAPSNLQAAGAPGQASLTWSPATDDVGVAHYNVHRGTTSGFTPTAANRIAQPVGTNYTDAGLGAGTYFYKVTAEDVAGNVGPASNEASATIAGGPAIASYGFEEGSGSTTVDLSGNANNATLSNTTWSTAGKFGKALSFNGASSMVTVADSNSLDLTTGGTIEGWVNPTANGGFRTLIVKERPGDLVYGLYASSDTNRPQSQVTVGGTARLLNGTATIPTGSWTHLAMTYDGATQRLYINGTQVSTLAISGTILTSSSPLRIGGNSIWSEWFAGLIDEVRVYNRALTAAEIQADMNAPVSPPDPLPPSAPGTLTATGGLGQVNLSWGPATDNLGVARYNVHRSTTPGFTPSAGNRIGQPTGTSYADSGLAAGTYYYKVTAEDAAGNVGPASNEASAAATADTTPPTAPTNLVATGAPQQVSLTWTPATDAGGIARYNVHRGTTSGFTPSAGNRIAQPTGTSYTDAGLAAGTYYYKVTAEDAAGNVGAVSNEASAVVTAPPTVGLVAAYGMDAGSGTALADQSGNGNNGTLTNATWAGGSAGKYGNALSFNGTNASVSIPSSTSLALTNGMTLEAWVRPTTLTNNDWNTVLFRERPGYYADALYANTGANRPSGNIYTNLDYDLRGTAQLPLATWTHLAVTYDGTVLALYVNGTQAATVFASGSIVSTTGALKIGGNAIWGEFFNGLIDEVRVYNRARTPAELQADMNTSISSPDATPPGAPGTLTATGGLGQVGLAWGPASDNVGVARYDVHRSTTPGFTPSAANRIAQPTGTSFTDAGLAGGTYYYKVTAEDAAGNVGPASNEATGAATADTTPPTVAITSPTGGATVSGTTAVNANASDNGTVVGVQFKLDGANLGAEDTSSPYSVSWDTFTASNGGHTLTAVARDGAGNPTTSSPVAVTVQNTASVGLVGAWAFDEGSGTTTADQSGRGNTGTLSNAVWVTGGKFNKALSFNGTNASVTVPDSTTLDLTNGMTLEAWVRPTTVGGWQTAIVKEQPGNLAYGMYSNTSANRYAAEVYVNGATRALNGTTQLPAATWSHLAATYDGATLRVYLNGTQTASLAQAGAILTSNSPLRIGSNAIWGEYFNGLIDEVRVYNRALSQVEIQSDMVRSVTPDTTPPTVTTTTPANGAAGINAGTSPTVTFNELMNSGSITSSSFVLKDSLNAPVPASVSYDPTTSVATLTPQSALQYGAAYTATVKGGAGGAADMAGNTLASDFSWTFTTEASPPPMLVVTSANRFTTYLGEILRNEGLDAFTTIDSSFISSSLLSRFDVVVLGDMSLTSAQVTTLSDWVSLGGNLIAMHPDKQLAGLLGLTDAGATLANAYLQVNTGTPAGSGIVGSTIQFHGTADRYALNGATGIATLYSTATTATANPAVTLRAVGTNGGQAAAFTYDLARSVVYTRQGNPAWAGQERDGVSGIRPDDMFFGARAGDVQPDWVDTNKISIPQADEQQRLLANLITLIDADKMPLPRFWYLPRGKKAAVVLSGDDHSPSQAPGGTASNFDRLKQLSPPGCVVANWECVRSSSYIYPNSVLTNAQAAGYVADGFEIGLHPLFASCPTAPISEAELGAGFDTQLAQFRAKYTSVPAQVSSRTHCVFWPDWASNAKVEAARGIRMDANYYHYPGSWIGTKNGFMNGGGFPMRFAELDGSLIDTYQANTNITDETTTAFTSAITALLDNALGPQGYYGAFGTNIHTDNSAPLPGYEQIVPAAQARSVPLISYKQLLDWVDGRNSSTIRGLSWNAGVLTFVTTIGAGANGLQTMLPTQGPSGSLSALTCAGSPTAYTTQTIKGIQYAMFNTINGTCRATYS